MEKHTQRPIPAYPGEVTDENIRKIFQGAGDFNYRKLKCGNWTLHTYAIDGLTSGGDISDYVFKPLALNGNLGTMGELYHSALNGMIYNAVASEC